VDTRRGGPGNRAQGLDASVDHGHHVRALPGSTSEPGRPSPSADPASPVRSIRTVVAPTARTTGSTARSPSLRPMT